MLYFHINILTLNFKKGIGEVSYSDRKDALHSLYLYISVTNLYVLFSFMSNEIRLLKYQNIHLKNH